MGGLSFFCKLIVLLIRETNLFNFEIIREIHCFCLFIFIFRIRQDLGGGAWCPKNMVGAAGDHRKGSGGEWIEVDLVSFSIGLAQKLSQKLYYLFKFSPRAQSTPSPPLRPRAGSGTGGGQSSRRDTRW